jgi:hypothetical protein
MLHGFKTWQELSATSPSEYRLGISILFAKAHRVSIQTATKNIYVGIT